MSGLRQAIVCYLQTSALRYSSKREHGKQSKSSLTPMIGDVTMFKDSKEKKVFGVIIEILKKNQVMVRCIRHKTATEIANHVRVLILLYKPTERNGDIPKMKS